MLGVDDPEAVGQEIVEKFPNLHIGAGLVSPENLSVSLLHGNSALGARGRASDRRIGV
jgi:hypothetical protein